MVASDTVVGLIGAGVLVVALVGVFVIESRPVPEKSGDMVQEAYGASVSGSIRTSGTYGTFSPNPIGPSLCISTGGCGTSFTEIDLRVSDLPALPGHYYAVFLRSENTTFGTQFYGVLTGSGPDLSYKTNSTSGVKADGKEASALIVSLETTNAPTAPSGRWSINASLAAAPNPPTTRALESSGSLSVAPGAAATASLQEIDAGLQVTVDLKEAAAYNTSEYRAWVFQNGTTGGPTYSYVGNITSTDADGHISGQATHGFADQKFGRVTGVVVVLSSAGQAPPEPGTDLAAGSMPPGAVVFTWLRPA